MTGPSRSATWLSTFAVCLAGVASAAAAPPGDTGTLAPAASRPVDFVRDIQPIFASRCHRCHGPRTQEGQLRLDARDLAFQGGVSGRAILKGNGNDSLLLRRVAGLGDGDQMPLQGQKLTAEQIGLIRAWIDQGAPWPDGAGPAVAVRPKHWAYVQPARPPVPAVRAPAWVQNPIDHFVLARLEREGLAPAPEASREQLLRRVSLDLIGLPPTLAEVEAFLADQGPGAYERVVDRLLASPRYGERWARPWLDAARYADSNGYQRDGPRSIWPYRDWVVQALNRDLPFDRFTVEQLAGDLLPGATPDQQTATGFHRNTMVNVEAGTDPEETRVEGILDRVNTTATVWLGTTLACAQCHHHKYDPFTQKEYYQLFAFFNNTAVEIAEGAARGREFIGPEMPLPAPHTQARREQLQAAIDPLKQRLDARAARLKADQAHWEQALAGDPQESKLPADIRQILALAAGKRTAKQNQQLTDYYLSSDAELQAGRARLAELQAELKALEPPTTLVMSELARPRMTHLFLRGDFLQKGEAVPPGTPGALHAFPAGQPANRLGLAYWLVAPDNPLVARVTVNRWWAELFGQGLVATLEDFGTQGARPAHPELLDWLATEFVARGWGMKALVRLLVTSATYRQSAKVTPALLERDRDNQLYARGPRFRLAAEQVRDNALAVSGLLSTKMGGPPVFPPQPDGIWNLVGKVDNTWRTSQGDDLYRRGLYVYWRRSSPYPSFVNFDAPSREACVVQRSRSNTPLQALTLLNDPVFVEAALALAQRMLTEPADTGVADRVAYGFRLCLTRQPAPAEVQLLAQVYHDERARFDRNPGAADRLTAKVPLPRGVDRAELAAWFAVANVLLNLDETITK